MFKPGVLPEVFPQARQRLAQESQPQGEQATEALLASVVEAFAQALEDAQTSGEPVAEIIEGEGAKQLIVITAGPDAEEQPEGSEPPEKPAGKGNLSLGE